MVKIEEERMIAIKILAEIEELLERKRITIPSDDRENIATESDEARLYGSEYYELEDAVIDILKGQISDAGSERTPARARSLNENEKTGSSQCAICGSNLFFVDETITHLEVDGEIVKQLGSGDLHNLNCVRCNFPEQYGDYKDYEAP